MKVNENQNPSTQPSESPHCTWFNDEWTDDVWQTDCGQTFQFSDGGPKENRFRFCYFCGKPLTELRRSETDDVTERGSGHSEG